MSGVRLINFSIAEDVLAFALASNRFQKVTKVIKSPTTSKYSHGTFIPLRPRIVHVSRKNTRYIHILNKNATRVHNEIKVAIQKDIILISDQALLKKFFQIQN